jgi:NAD(P)-dependent dehydrogenase (short-subunit alcohol dehydrogenase family)
MPWTAADIPDLVGRTAVVTGANSGLGYRTSLELARHRALVVLACRDEVRGAEARSRLIDEVPHAQLELATLDLADLGSVGRFAELFGAAHSGLDLLVNNAGVMAIPARRTADGYEMQFGTNHLGPFALTGLLLPQLLARPGARVVTVSSTAARAGRIALDDLNAERRYRPWAAYSQSKLANLLFTLELQHLAEAAGVDLVAVAAHPGYAATNLQSVGPQMSGRRLPRLWMAIGNRLLAQSDAMGALPQLHAATAPDVTGGDYFGPGGLFGQRGYPTLASIPPAASDREVGRRLWEASERLTGVRYEALSPPDRAGGAGSG